MDIYAPIANRLGMGLLKGELEDLAFLHLEPQEYARVRREVERNLAGSEAMIEQIRAELARKLVEAGVAGEVTGRRKRYHSISAKMKRRGVDVAQLYDVLAFRVVTPETRDCYAVLGLVHQRWRPDARPHQGLHRDAEAELLPVAPHDGHERFRAALRGPDPHAGDGPDRRAGDRGALEVQGGRLGPHADDARFQWLRQLVDWQSEVSDPRQFLSSLKVDLYPDEVYTFTPKGRSSRSPAGRRRSISRTGCTRTSGTAAWARASTGGSSR